MSVPLVLLCLAIFALAQETPKEPPKNTPAPPKENPKNTPATPPVIASGCCCCVDSVDIRLIGRAIVEKSKKHIVIDDPDADPEEFDREIGAQFGHEFKVFVKYRNKRIKRAGEKPGDCVLKWLE